MWCAHTSFSLKSSVLTKVHGSKRIPLPCLAIYHCSMEGSLCRRRCAGQANPSWLLLSLLAEFVFLKDICQVITSWLCVPRRDWQMRWSVVQARGSDSGKCVLCGSSIGWIVTVTENTFWLSLITGTDAEGCIIAHLRLLCKKMCEPVSTDKDPTNEKCNRCLL